jgi:hypothetical protein
LFIVIINITQVHSRDNKKIGAVQKENIGQLHPKNTLPKAPKSDFNAVFGPGTTPLNGGKG